MTSPYESELVNNMFQQLDNDSSLWVLSLCLASHDILLHHSLIDKSEAGEKNYHFAVSLSILREIANMFNTNNKLDFAIRFSKKTKDLFRDLERELKPFTNNSLTKGTLVPIRNMTFHYDFTKAGEDEKKRMSKLLDEIKTEPKLRVRATSGDNSIFRYRYTFADAFRSKLLETYLTTDLVDKISVATVNLIDFTDSLLSDLAS